MIDPVHRGLVSKSGNAARTETSATAKPESNRRAAGQANLPHLLTLAADVARAGAPIDDARIAKLRAAIADGSYAPDAEAVARSMIRFFTGQ